MDFFQTSDPTHSMINATWDLRLVLLSYIVAAVASYTALDLADRVIKTRASKVRGIWLVSGAFAMGVGIWSMHFTGMLAFDMDMPVTYDIPVTLLSMMVAVLASGVALFTVSRQTINNRRLLLGSFLMGVGIASMHYIGMEAMRMPATLGYRFPLVGLSVLIAIGASLMALSLASRFSRDDIQGLKLTVLKVMSGLVMGGAIVGMHYTGMWAAIFRPTAPSTPGGAEDILLGVAIGVATLVVLGIALISSMVDRRFALQASYLEASERRYGSLFQENPDAVFMMDLDGEFTSVNQAVTEISGYSQDEVLGARHGGFGAPGQTEKIRQHFEKALQRDPQNFETAIRTKDGRRVDLNLTYVPIIVEDKVRGVYGIGKDITERKALERELEHRAYTDPLTGLANRDLFTERLEQALVRTARHKHPLAVLFLDLDNFKYVNDSLGHEIGDRLLIEVSSCIQSLLRETDITARLGGDEFAVLLEDLEGEGGATRVAQRIFEKLEAPFLIGEQKLRTTFSMGIVLATSGKETPDELLRDADTAMYRAKHRGRNRYELFEPGMNKAAQNRLELERNLRYAMENGQLTVHYQPKVWVEDGSIYGMEALVRWDRPGHGLTSPGEFIPVAEETGLVVPLGSQVMEQACRQLKEWQDQYPDREPLTVSVNVSPQQFLDGLAEKVSQVLWETGLAPDTLILEITESAAMEDTEFTKSTLQELKRLGVRLSIDDFGTGYSSLSYLKNLPVDNLKIDRSFINGLEDDPANIAVTNAVIALSRSLGLQVVAEGVETVEQLANLQELGCDLAQGFYFSKPLPPEEMSELLAGPSELGDTDVRRTTRAFGYFSQAKSADEKAQLLNRAIAAGTDSIVITDHTKPDCPIIYLNERFEQVTGYSAEETLGYNCRFLQGDDEDQPALEGVRAAIKEGQEYSCVLRNYRKDGTMFWNELRIAPVYDKDGILTNYIGIQNDVTERVQEQRELREREEQLRAILVDYSSDVITVLNRDGTIRYQSPSSDQVLGYKPEDLYGLSAFEMIHPEDHSRVYEELEKILNNPGGNSSPVQLKYRHADGSWRLVEAIANNLLKDPRIEGILINSRDITDRETSENNDRQNPTESKGQTNGRR